MTPLILAVCSWANPGADPYMGDVVSAVDRYRDIPVETRAALKARMLARQYDDIAVIRRDSIEGAQAYADLRDMHFGNGRLCQQPSRALWPAQHVERGLVYCEAEHCLIVPTVCRNVSRVTRLKRPTPLSPPAADPAPEPAPAPEPDPAPDTRRYAASIGSTSAPPASTILVPEEPPAWHALPAPPGAPAPFFNPVTPVTPIPEPSTYALLALGLALMAWARRNA